MPTSITSSGITFDDATTQTTSALAAGAIGTTQLASAAVTPAKLSQPLTLATSVATTSGTSIDFTGIPSWVKRITVMLNGVSTNGTSIWQLQVGSGTFQTSGYNGSFGYSGTTQQMSGNTSGFGLYNDTASDVMHGAISLFLLSGNTWTISGMTSWSTRAFSLPTSGSVTLSDTLDRIRLTTVNGTDTFDAGEVNISYEG
jgi:hypothetical protein